MSFIQRQLDNSNLATYENLELIKGGIEQQVQDWVDQALAFYNTLTDPTEQTEMQTMRAEFIANLRAILGV